MSSTFLKVKHELWRSVPSRIQLLADDVDYSAVADVVVVGAAAAATAVPRPRRGPCLPSPPHRTPPPIAPRQPSRNMFVKLALLRGSNYYVRAPYWAKPSRCDDINLVTLYLTA